MTVLRFKDLSTAHLTDGDAELLDTIDLPVTTMKYKEGWIVSTAGLISEEFRDQGLERLQAHGLSQAFIAAALDAARNDC